MISDHPRVLLPVGFFGVRRHVAAFRGKVGRASS
jgi:hypothetical protein